MSDSISKAKTTKWIATRMAALEPMVAKHTGYHKRHLMGQHSALVDVAWEIESGAFDIAAESGDETELQMTAELGRLARENERLRDKLQQRLSKRVSPDTGVAIAAVSMPTRATYQERIGIIRKVLQASPSQERRAMIAEIVREELADDAR